MEEAIILGAKRALRELGIDTVETPEPNLPLLDFQITSQYYRSQDYVTASNPIVNIGNKNRVIWDGVPYDCKTEFFFLGTTTNKRIYVGNPVVYNDDIQYNFEDNGLPFTISLTVRSDGTVTTSIYGDTGTHTIEIQNLVSATTPIDPKYLVKEINLNDYLVGGSSLGMVILMAGMSGQKVVTPVTIPAKFFADCDVENPLRFTIEASLDGGISIRQEFGGICKNYMNGQLSQISYSFVSWFNNTLFEGSISILPGAIVVNSSGTAASLG